MRNPLADSARLLWEKLVEPVRVNQGEEHRLARALNSLLILLMIWAIVAVTLYQFDRKPFGLGEVLPVIMLAFFGLSYALNRSGHFYQALVLNIVTLSGATFVIALTQLWKGNTDTSAFYYLMVVIVIGEIFLSRRGFLISTALLLTGIFVISLWNRDTIPVFLFLLIFGSLIGFSGYIRRITMAADPADESQLRSEQRRAHQLELLEEVGRRIADSFEEKEILERALEAVVNKFGYAEAAISLLTKDDFMEVTAITGTEDFGYRPGFRQEMGQGVIGHVAQTRQPYVTSDVSNDPYYFSTAKRYGSAAGIPILNKDELLGVLYVESTREADLSSDDVQTLQTLANQVATSLQRARLHAATQEHLHVMTTLQSVSHAVTSSLELNEIFHNVIELLKDSFGYSYISVYLLEGNILRLGAELGYPEDLILHEIPITAGIIGRTARSKMTQFIEDVDRDPDFLRASYEVQSEVCVPLLKKGNVLGVLNVESKEEHPLDERDVNLLNALAGPLAIAIDNAHLHAEVKTMALTDTICGLPNRRAFDETLHTEIMRAHRYNNPLSLIILDLDSFKEFNDQYGHPAGDVRLKEIGDLLKENVREPDLAARYGGEEFAIILPNTSKTGAIRLAERLRHFAQSKAPGGNHDGHAIAGYTVSLGVATFPDDAVTLKDLVLAADNAELTAKRLGKNRVATAETLDAHQT